MTREQMVKHLNFAPWFKDESQRCLDFWDEIKKITGEDPDFMYEGMFSKKVKFIGQFKAIYMRVSIGTYMLIFMNCCVGYIGPVFEQRCFIPVSEVSAYLDACDKARGKCLKEPISPFEKEFRTLVDTFVSGIDINRSFDEAKFRRLCR